MFQVRTFPCPNCKEFINDSMQICKFCSTPIDPGIAQFAAELQERVNRACNHASSIRNAAGAMWIFFLVRFIPCLGLAGLIGFAFVFFFVPIASILWQVKFGDIQSADVDFKHAKRNKNIALLIWAPSVILMLLWITMTVLSMVGWYQRESANS